MEKIMSETKTVWHKCPDEKPPREDELYLVTIRNSLDDEIYVHTVGWTYGRWVHELFRCELGEKCEVLAWAELPEPYEPD